MNWEKKKINLQQQNKYKNGSVAVQALLDYQGTWCIGTKLLDSEVTALKDQTVVI